MTEKQVLTNPFDALEHRLVAMAMTDKTRMDYIEGLFSSGLEHRWKEFMADAVTYGFRKAADIGMKK